MASTGRMLPVELTDCILDFLHDDHVTLRVCSKVFPQELVERHLYADITFLMMPEKMRNAVGDRAYRDPRSIDPTAFQLLLVENPHVANYVRSLRIEVISQSGSGYDFALSSSCGDEISPLLYKLNRLESVTLTPRGMRVMWHALGDVFRSTFFKTLRQPTMKEVSILNIGRFPLSLLDDCKSLQSLSLQGTFSDIDLESTSPYPRLQSLRIIDQLSSQVFLTRLFTSWANTNSIRSLTLKLSLHCTGFIDRHVITRLLQAYSGSLTSLRIDFPDYSGKLFHCLLHSSCSDVILSQSPEPISMQSKFLSFVSWPVHSFPSLTSNGWTSLSLSRFYLSPRNNLRQIISILWWIDSLPPYLQLSTCRSTFSFSFLAI